MAQVFQWKYYGRDKRVDTHWWIRYRDASGKDRRERIGPSKRQAEQALASRVAAVTEGRAVPGRRDGEMLFGDFAREYMESQGRQLAWSRTVQIAIEHWKRHLGPRCKLRDVSARQVEAFRSKRLSAGVTPATCNRNLAVIKRMLNVAVDWNLIHENPVLRVKLLREQNARVRWLNESEIGRLIPAARASRNTILEPLVRVALNTGARRGELLGLRWSDVNFEAATIGFARTKNGERRDIPVNDTVLGALRKLRAQAGKGDRVFAIDGKPVIDFRTAWDNALAEAGIEDFHFHDLRHTFASHMTMEGVDVRVLQRLLGHKCLTMTMRYSHLSPGGLRAAVQRVALGA